MCGIAGILQTRGAISKGRIEAMTAALAHRGPDGSGVEVVGDRVALGHRRLAIIDLESGRQPMCNEDGSVWITFNGEIYNYQELSRQLAATGHIFKSRSDTEAIIHAYEHWGPECVKRLRGMFAFGIADFKRQRIVLARDHFGIKPLYYRKDTSSISFASEIAALRANEEERPRGNILAADYFFRFEYIPTPHTIYENVFKLPPAHYLTFGFDGIMPPPTRYWNLQFRPEKEQSEDAWLEEADSVITESVKAHLVADVPFGVLLSGGIDSTLVTAKMSDLLNHEVIGFSIGFNEKSHSEIPFAHDAADKIGIKLHTEIVEVDSLELLPDLLLHYGEPFADNSMIPTWYVSKIARSKVPMVLSGDGGDEGFGGYASYQRWMTWNPWLHFVKRSFQLKLRSAGEALRFAAEFRLFPGNKTRSDEWLGMHLRTRESTRAKLWRPEYHSAINHPCELFEDSAHDARHLERMSFCQYMDYQTYLPCNILTKVDIASMCHGLEVRTPLVDIKIAELFSRLPSSLRFRKNVPANWQGKFLLKKLLQKRLGYDFVNRPKQGFDIPTRKWLEPGTKGFAIAKELLGSSSAPVFDLLDTTYISSKLAGHAGGENNSGILWLSVIFATWMNLNPGISFK